MSISMSAGQFKRYMACHEEWLACDCKQECQPGNHCSQCELNLSIMAEIANENNLSVFEIDKKEG